MRLRIYLLAFVSTFALTADVASAKPLTLSEGTKANTRYANLENRELTRKGYDATYEFEACRRSRSDWGGLVVVWCPIIWHYDPPLEGQWTEDRTRIFALHPGRDCIFVKEALFAGHRCFRRSTLR